MSELAAAQAAYVGFASAGLELNMQRGQPSDAVFDLYSRWDVMRFLGTNPTVMTEPAQAEEIVASGKADMVAMARAFLDNPRWVWLLLAVLVYAGVAVARTDRFQLPEHQPASTPTRAPLAFTCG